MLILGLIRRVFRNNIRLTEEREEEISPPVWRRHQIFPAIFDGKGQQGRIKFNKRSGVN